MVQEGTQINILSYIKTPDMSQLSHDTKNKIPFFSIVKSRYQKLKRTFKALRSLKLYL